MVVYNTIKHKKITTGYAFTFAGILWLKFTLNLFPLTAEDIRLINQSLDSLQFPEEVGRGYSWVVEVFHQVSI